MVEGVAALDASSRRVLPGRPAPSGARRVAATGRRAKGVAVVDPARGYAPGMGAAFRDAFPILYVDDVRRSLHFYRDLLGFTETYRWDDDGEPVYVALELGTTRLALSDAASFPLHGQPRAATAGCRLEVCVYADDVDVAVAELRAAGVEVLMEPADQPWGERAAYVADPDGNPVFLLSPLDAA